jgi:hypothetical protein
MGCIVQGGEDVLAFPKWVIFEDFLEGGSRSKQFEHIGNTPHFPASTVIRLRRSTFMEFPVVSKIRNVRFKGEAQCGLQKARV